MTDNISIVVPTFNSAKTIRQCLDSLISQKFLPVIIIADGGSTDETMAIVKSYGDKISVSFSEPDNGVFDAWNKGLSHVTTPWVVFIGSDDFYYDTECLTALENEISSVSDSVGVIYPHIYKYINEKVIDSKDNGPIVIPESRKFKNMPFTHCGSAHRMKAFDELGKFNSEFRIAGDFDFISRMMGKYSIHYAPLYKVCIGVDGLSMSSKNRKRLVHELIYIYKEYGVYGFNFSTLYLMAKYVFYYLVSALKND